MRELKTRTAFLMEDVEAAEALDDRTLEVRLREPRSYFPYVLCSPWAFPWPRHRCEALGDDWAKPENLVGNGPFMLVEFDDDHALLRANPHWSGPRGNVGEIHFSFYPKGAQMVEGWREGRFDLLHVYDPVSEDEPDTIGDVVPELGLQYIGFSADSSPFSNQLVRKAFSHAVDREALARSTFADALARGDAAAARSRPRCPPTPTASGAEYDLDTCARAARRGRLPGRQGPTRDPRSSSRTGSSRSSRSPSCGRRSARV